MEKPLARTYRDAIALAELADSLGRRLLPGHVVRFFPEYVQLQRAVSSGALGSLAVLRFTRAGSFPTRSAWFADVARSGGIVFDQMLHDLDFARWLAGEVVAVSAVSRHDESGSVPGPGGPCDPAARIGRDHAGVRCLGRAAPGVPYLVLRRRDRWDPRARLRRQSDRAQQQLDHDHPTDGLLPARDAADDPYLTELTAFLDPVADPTRIVSARDGAEAVRIAEAALASLATGQPTRLSDMSRRTGSARFRPEAGIPAIRRLQIGVASRAHVHADGFIALLAAGTGRRRLRERSRRPRRA